MNRDEILNTAVDIVCGQREQEYGPPDDNFTTIAALWSDYLGYSALNAKDVAIMMILFKVGRLSTGAGSADTWVDIAGYAACGGEIATKEDTANG